MVFGKSKKTARVSLGVAQHLARPDPHWELTCEVAPLDGELTVIFEGTAPPSEADVQRVQAAARFAIEASDQLIAALVANFPVDPDDMGVELATALRTSPGMVFRLELLRLTLARTGVELGYGIVGWDDALATVCVDGTEVGDVYYAD